MMGIEGEQNLMDVTSKRTMMDEMDEQNLMAAEGDRTMMDGVDEQNLMAAESNRTMMDEVDVIILSARLLLETESSLHLFSETRFELDGSASLFWK